MTPESEIHALVQELFAADRAYECAQERRNYFRTHTTPTPAISRLCGLRDLGDLVFVLGASAFPHPRQISFYNLI